jgi:hypothetical protein
MFLLRIPFNCSYDSADLPLHVVAKILRGFSRDCSHCCFRNRSALDRLTNFYGSVGLIRMLFRSATAYAATVRVTIPVVPLLI